MKKFLFTFLICIMFFGVANAATSDDVYLRKDVFDAKMDAFMAEIRLMNMGLRQEMNERFDEVNKRFSEVDKQIAEIKGDIKTLNAKVDGNFANLSTRIDDTNKQLDRNFANLSTRIDDTNKQLDGNFANLSTRIDDMNKQADRSNNFIYLIMVFIGLVLVAPFFQNWLNAYREKHNPLFTTEELTVLKRLIEINSSSLTGK